MWLKLTSIVAITTLSAYTATEVVDQLKPQATESAAQQAVINITDAAYLEQTLNGTEWETALANTVANARHAGSVTVTGTVLRWELDDVCYTADATTPDTEPTIVLCTEGAGS